MKKDKPNLFKRGNNYFYLETPTSEDYPTLNSDGSISYKGIRFTNPEDVDRATGLTVTLPEVTVEGKRPYNPYSFGTYVPFEYSRNSYYKPEDAMEAFNTITLGGLNNLSPTQWIRRAYDFNLLRKGKMSFSDFTDKWLNGNNGVVSDSYAKEHPWITAGINMVGDLGAVGTFGAMKQMPAWRAALQAEERAALEATAINWRDMLANSTRRTKLGDVEIDNPLMMYRQGTPEMVDDFIKKGKVEAGHFLNPMFNQGELFYNFPRRKDFNLSFNRHGTNGLITTTEDMLPAGTDATPLPISELDETLTGRIPNNPITPYNASAYKWNPGYGYRKVGVNNNNISLKFYERNPSRISNAERLGIPKGDRGNLSLNQRYAINDLYQYINLGQYKVFRVSPDWELFGWNLNRSNPTFLLLFAADGKSMNNHNFARVVLQTPTGKGVISWNPEKGMGGYSSKSFPTPLGMNWSPGEATMMLDGNYGLKIILTAPRTDFLDGVSGENIEHFAENLPLTIDKNIMKDFWINARKVLKPGSYLSGDNGKLPLGSSLIESFNKKLLYKLPISERPLELLFVRRTGLSPDSYSSIIRLGNRDGSLRWGEGFIKWNPSAIENKHIFNAYLQLLKKEITPKQYEEIFNKWSLDIGGRPLQWVTIGNNKLPVHPHPYIYAKEKGGILNN